MRILINHKEAIIKSGSSFEFISENRYFTGSDSYTMAIEFPLAGCPQNLAIFGHINRKDIEAKQYLFDCEIFAGRFYKSGSITITEISDKAVKCQFLEGRSVQNYDNTLDEIFINELSLGSWPDAFSNTSVAEAFLICEIPTYTAVPWVNNSSGNLQNAIIYTDDVLNWDPDFVSSTEKRVSFMPFMIFIFKKIFDALEYTYDIQAWETSRYKWLLICNCVPGAWDKTDWAYVLPRWTVTEFLEELEKLMNCQFVVDSVNKTVKMSFPSTASASQNVVEIKAINEFTATKTEEDESEYEENMGKKYADVDSEIYTAMVSTIPREEFKKQEQLGPGRYSERFPILEIFNTIGEITEINYTLPTQVFIEDGSKGGYKTKSLNEFYVSKGKFCKYDYQDPLYPNTRHEDIDSTQFYVQRVGEFAPIEPKESDGKSVELKIVPAIIDEIDYDFAIFLDPGEMKTDDDIYEDYDGSTTKGDIYLRKYDKADPVEVYDKIFVAFWNATIFDTFKDERTLVREKWVNQGSSGQGPQYWEYEEQNVTKRCIPHPIISNYEPVWKEACKVPIYFKFEADEKKYSLALEASNVVNKTIDGRVKFTVKFIANDIPDVGSVFIISGQQFLCKKITATFTEKGMSQMLKGEFYRIVVPVQDTVPEPQPNPEPDPDPDPEPEPGAG